MASEKITQYIAGQRARGVTDDAIRTELLKAGWAEDAVNAGFSAPLEVPMSGNISSGEIPGTIELIRSAWEMLTKRPGLFIGLALLPLLAVVVGLGILFVGMGSGFFSWISGGAGAPLADLGTVSNVPMITLGVVLFIISMVVLSVYSTAASYASAQDESIRDFGLALSTGGRHFGAVLWTTILTGVVIFVGFLLLIIPGIIFSIWYLFAVMISVVEGKSGGDALRRSKELVRGRGWTVFMRIVVAYLFVLLISLALGMFGSVGQIIQFVFNLILGPMAILFTFQLYRALAWGR